MTSLKVSFCLLVLLLAGSIASAKQSVNALEKRAGVFLLKQAVANSRASNLFTNDTCEEDEATKPSVACINYVAGSYPSSDQRIRAARACAGNVGIACAEYIAGSYPSFDQREAAAIACRNVIDISCAQYVAGSYPSHDQRVVAAKACKNATRECVEYTAGSYPSFDQRVAAAKACGGQP